MERKSKAYIREVHDFAEQMHQSIHEPSKAHTYTKVSPAKQADEFDGILAFFIYEFTSKAMHEPTESFDDVIRMNPFSSLREKGRRRLKNSAKRQFQQLKEVPTDPIIKYYERLKQINPNAEDRINSGINAAVYVMSKMFEVIPVLYPDVNPQVQGYIARVNYPFIMGLAMNQDGQFNNKIRALTGQNLTEPFVDEEASIKSGTLVKNGLHIDFAPEVKKLFYPDRKDHNGCPAAFNPGGGSSIKKLFDWFAEQADTIYQQQYERSLVFSLKGGE